MPQSFPGLGHVYDLAVVGAGFAGTELALACARVGLDVLLVTTSLDTLYMLAGDGAVLEPSPGTFLAELVFELRDENGLVNAWALHRRAKYALEHSPRLHLLQSSVTALRCDGERVVGLETWEGVPRLAARTALCVGSFLGARLRLGALTETAGRLSEMAYDDLYHDLQRRGFAFEEARFTADEAQGSLPYAVDCQVFAASEREGFRLRQLEGLYAAGVCLEASLGYEGAAKHGADLAAALVAEDSG